MDSVLKCADFTADLGARARFRDPTGRSCDAAGNLYLVTPYGSVVQLGETERMLAQR